MSSDGELTASDRLKMDSLTNPEPGLSRDIRPQETVTMVLPSLPNLSAHPHKGKDLKQTHPHSAGRAPRVTSSVAVSHTSLLFSSFSNFGTNTELFSIYFFSHYFLQIMSKQKCWWYCGCFLLCRDPEEEAAVSHRREERPQPHPQRALRKRRCVSCVASSRLLLLLQRRPGRPRQTGHPRPPERSRHEHQGWDGGRRLLGIRVSRNIRNKERGAPKVPSGGIYLLRSI